MKTTKVRMVLIDQYPTKPPYVQKDSFYYNKFTGQIFQSETTFNKKEFLDDFQPVKLALVSFIASRSTKPINKADEGVIGVIINKAFHKIILPHEQLINSEINCEVLDSVVDEGGTIKTAFKTIDFNLSLCELIILENKGICWVQPVGEDKNIIHVEEK